MKAAGPGVKVPRSDVRVYDWAGTNVQPPKPRLNLQCAAALAFALIAAITALALIGNVTLAYEHAETWGKGYLSAWVLIAGFQLGALAVGLLVEMTRGGGR